MIRIVVTEASPGAAEGIRSRLTSSEFEIVGYARDGLEAAQMAVRLEPDVLIAHEKLPEVSGFRVSELVNAATSDVGVVILVEKESDAILRQAMASGARAVLAIQAPAERYAEVLSQVASVGQVRNDPEYPLVTDPERMPHSIAVTSAKGGTGKTTVAVNLGVLFAKRFPDQVALVDFCGQFGDGPLALDVPGSSTIADLASFDELDPELVQTHLVAHPASSLRLLAAPDMRVSAAEVDMDRLNIPFMASLIGLLRRAYRFVFFDMPPLVWPTSQYVFSRCQQILVVTNLFDLATIGNTRTLLDVVAASVGDAERVKLVVNRSPRRGDYSIEDLEETTGRKTYIQLPDDFESASGALNAGVPVVLESPNSALARALGALSEKLVAEL